MVDFYSPRWTKRYIIYFIALVYLILLPIWLIKRTDGLCTTHHQHWVVYNFQQFNKNIDRSQKQVWLHSLLPQKPLARSSWNTASRLINLGNSLLYNLSVHNFLITQIKINKPQNLFTEDNHNLEAVEFSWKPFNWSSHWIPAKITENRYLVARQDTLLLSNDSTLRLIILFIHIEAVSMEC